MSAMPERVWVYLKPDLYDPIAYDYKMELHGSHGATAYVPESRLLAAEARVREVEAAFKKYGDHWAQCPAMTPRRKCNCGYAQARATLAREET